MNPAIHNRRRSLPPRAALTLVESRLPADPFLLRHFERFYADVVDLKAQLSRSSHTHASLPPEEVQQRLFALLTDQEEQVSRIGTLLGAEMYRQAQRVMACMADEIFAHIHWPQGKEWRSLEMELFAAVEMKGLAADGPCMKKLDLLLREDDPAYRELAAIYFYALSLTQPEQHIRQQYSQPLFEMICGDSKGKTGATPHLFEQSYAHTLAENTVTLLPSVERWWLVLAAIVLIWLAASWLLWQQVSFPLDHKLQEIHQAAKP